MPGRKRQRREPTHDWQEIEQLTIWPEQEVYERLRPVILFGQTAAERAKETGASERTLHYQAKLFEQEGMASLFPKERSPAAETGRSLPEEMRQLIVNLKFEHPGFTPHEIATICFLHFERRPVSPYGEARPGRGTRAFHFRAALSTLRPDHRWVSKTPRHC